MRFPSPRYLVAFATVGSGLLAGCVQYNTLYNAESLYREAEDLRLTGPELAVRERYREVIAKATKGYEADEDGARADDALLLIAKAQLRLGAIPEANRTLERAIEISDDPGLRGQATLYRGAAAVAAGEAERGRALLDQAITAIDDGSHLAEGHLWRARARFGTGMVEEGWKDLDRAGELHDGHAVHASLERVAWGFTLSDLTRIHQGIQALLLTSRAEVYGDSIRTLVRRFADRWGAWSAVVLLDGTEDARWSRAARDRLLMTRAGLSYEAGDVGRAKEDARRVGSGVGAQAWAARVTLARWTLAAAQRVDDLAPLRSVLLPAVMSDEAQALLNSIRRVELLTEYGLDGEPTALIAAAEISRDRLTAPRLSAALFELHADQAPDSPWFAKALLAAGELTGDSAERKRLDERLDERLDAVPGDPYLRYARSGHDVPELGELEYRLQSELDALIVRVDEELTARRQLRKE